MQGKKNLEKTLVLSLLLASVWFSTAGATITSGTHDIGGTIDTSAGFVNATSNVVINATDNITLTNNSTKEVPFLINNDATSITMNMNNHDLAVGTKQEATFYVTGTSKSTVIANAKNVNITDNGGSAIDVYDANSSTIAVRANNDINMTGNESNIFLDNSKNITVDLNAGHDFTMILNVSHNEIKTNNTTYSKINITAGNDVRLIQKIKTVYPLLRLSGESTQINIVAKNGNITVSPKQTDGVNAYSGAIDTLHAGKSIIIGDANGAADAIYANNGTVDLTSDADDIKLIANYTGNGYNAGVEAYGSAGAVNLHSSTDISAVKYGVLAANSSKVTFDKKATIHDAQCGVGANKNSIVTINGDAIITAKENGISANGGLVTLAKAATLSGAPIAIKVTNGGLVAAKNTASAKKITGDITSDGIGSSVDVAVTTADSYLTGATETANGGTINLELANGGVWNVTADSTLTNLANNATVNLRHTGNSTDEKVVVDNLSGNGTYVINTDLEASYDSKDVLKNGDKIFVTTSSSGNNLLDLRDISLDTKIASQGYLLLVADYSNGSATFSGKDLAHGGIFKYKPVITTENPTDYTGFDTNAKNWYLTGFERLIEVSDNTKATLGLSGTRYANYFMDQDTLLKRLGELRMLKGEPEQNGIWARYRHGGMEGSGFSGGSSMVQVGYDKKTSNKRYTGIAFNHTSNTYDFDGGASGDGSQDAVTVYNTWLGEKNHYFDIVGKLGKMRGYSTYEDSLYPEKGHYDSWYCSISGEYGRKNIDKNGWYYEPQAQLTLGRIRGNDYTTGLGTRVNMASITSLISRAGVTLGKEYNMKDSNTHSNIYGKINWLHEFKGDVNTSLLDTYGDRYDHKKEYGGSWWNVGFGATINVNKNTHMYLDFEKNFGGKVTTNWIGQLGCQWTWK